MHSILASIWISRALHPQTLNLKDYANEKAEPLGPRGKVRNQVSDKMPSKDESAELLLLPYGLDWHLWIDDEVWRGLQAPDLAGMPMMQPLTVTFSWILPRDRQITRLQSILQIHYFIFAT
ncbi:hypothetical protein ACKF11_00465 [Methylobacillus sp. Pita2]|uniref:hypothetical protein n=1 Tax=unclassified Methylobacillus TaxID=2647660 RepID=UPI0038B5753C